jgi:hypothetical protein
MLTFPNVTPQVFALVLDQLRTEATVIEWSHGPPPIFQVSGNGIEANTTLADGGFLHVDIGSKPWWMTEGMIGAKIRDAITLAQQAVAKAGQGGDNQTA